MKDFLETVLGNDSLTSEEMRLLVWKATVSPDQIEELTKVAERHASGFNGNLAKASYFNKLREEYEAE